MLSLQTVISARPFSLIGGRPSGGDCSSARAGHRRRTHIPTAIKPGEKQVKTATGGIVKRDESQVLPHVNRISRRRPFVRSFTAHVTEGLGSVCEHIDAPSFRNWIFPNIEINAPWLLVGNRTAGDRQSILCWEGQLMQENTILLRHALLLVCYFSYEF